MTVGGIAAGGRQPGSGYICACCGVKMLPYFSENAVINQNTINQLISDSFLTVKGAALFLPRGNGSSTPRISHRRSKHAGDLQLHLQAMFTLLRPEDNIRLAVRLESTYLNRTRYMVVVSTNGRQDTEESVVLGMDFSTKDSSSCTLGLVLPLWSDTLIHLDGDGGFSVSTDNRVHIFKPVSVQAMWSALQSLHKACEVARTQNYFPGSLFLTWISYYESHINSDQSCINEWNAMPDVQCHRSDSPVLFTDIPTERERTERLIKTKLREIMMQKDLENVTSKEIRTELEMQMAYNLREFKEFIDNEMIVILGQMDSPTEIFDHVFLGSEWNASNLEDLQNRGVRYILNVTREIDNFFPGLFEYHNIRVYDEEATDLLAYWNDTYKFISKAKKNGSKCLVHCKMGVSRSASTVIAYAMKEYGWNLDRAFNYVKERRTVTKPNPSFMKQLEEYQGILVASKQRHNKLWRSHSDGDLSDHREPISKPEADPNKHDGPCSASILSAKSPQDAVFSCLTHGLHADPSENGAELEISLNHFDYSCASCDCQTEEEVEEWTRSAISGCPADLSLHNYQLAPCSDNIEQDFDNSLQSESPSEGTKDLHDLKLEDLGNDALGPERDCVTSEPIKGDHPGLSPTPLSLQSDTPAETSCLSTDRIDFFSAREKFVELSEESRTRAFSYTRTEEQSTGKMASLKVMDTEVCSLELNSGNHRHNSEEESQKESRDLSSDEEKEISEPSSGKMCRLTRSQSESVSVKEIVTEIESINQGTGLCQQKTETSSQLVTPKRNTIHELQAELVSATEVKTGKPEPSRECSSAGLIEIIQDSAKQKLFTSQQVPAEVEESADAAVAEETFQHCTELKVEPKRVSVKRATKEFEERMRLEQEQQNVLHSCALPSRRNSRNESSAASEPCPKGKAEDSPSESPDTTKESEKEKIVKIKSLGPKAKVPHSAEAATDAQLSPSELHPVQSKNEHLNTVLEARQGTKVEHRTVHSFEAPEKLVLQSPLPKKIEIIEYTVKKNEPDLQESRSDPCVLEYRSEEKNPGKLKAEGIVKAVPITVDSEVAETPNMLSLGLPLKEGTQATTLSRSSPEEETECRSSNAEFTPVICHAANAPFQLPDYFGPKYAIHLTGVTELSSETDELAFPRSEDSSHISFGGSNDMLQRAGDSGTAQLSTEDLCLIDKLSERIRELHEVLDLSIGSCGLPHSSSTDSVKDLASTPGMVKQRAKEIEARIRQAGLTTPSQMKRSASLAKLGCLELSTDDLSERESVCSESNQTCSDVLQNSRRLSQDRSEVRGEWGYEDHSKKLCFCVPVSQEEPAPTACFVEQIRTAECVVESKPVEKPLVQYAKEFASTQEDSFQNRDSELIISEDNCIHLCTANQNSSDVETSHKQQHGRSHPVRRLRKTNEKKRTANPLYNTM
ncbi:protein phosphatase Slingshot homolog 2 isoform X2 [Protopterus annectens]|uniref:protein phosphatase Slingshot homolog 2 isoform X2 n=1 Tax=Protopterus annectens TaxID=7888 RepID=UPI001CF9C27F|nr:protein phosphatase Slingshot homolog 2 isoform X2 [Protopterus annectens]